MNYNLITEDIITKVAPRSKSCTHAPIPEQCITARDAVSYLNEAFKRYDIDNAAAQAAVVALISMESSEFKYNRAGNGTATNGRGTRSMMSPTMVVNYAVELHGPVAVSDARNEFNSLKMVLRERDSMASGAWYLRRICPQMVGGFARRPEQLWRQYIESCLGYEMNDERMEYWDRAKDAFGL